MKYKGKWSSSCCRREEESIQTGTRTWRAARRAPRGRERERCTNKGMPEGCFPKLPEDKAGSGRSKMETKQTCPSLPLFYSYLYDSISSPHPALTASACPPYPPLPVPSPSPQPQPQWGSEPEADPSLSPPLKTRPRPSIHPLPPSFHPSTSPSTTLPCSLTHTCNLQFPC